MVWKFLTPYESGIKGFFFCYHEIIVIEVKTHYYKYVQNIEKPNSLEQEKHRA